MNQLAVDWEHHDRFIAPSYTNLGVGSLPIGGADVYALMGHRRRKQRRASRTNYRRRCDGGIRIALKRAGWPSQSVGPMRSRSRGRFGSH